jgi:predicted nucleic acid-binding protein
MTRNFLLCLGLAAGLYTEDPGFLRTAFSQVEHVREVKRK